MRSFDLENHRLDPTTIVLEASAGTGKTFSLTALVIRLLVEGTTDGVHPALNGILLVTFTNKATDELRTRLRQRLELACRLWSTDVLDAALTLAAQGDEFLQRYRERRQAHRAHDLRRLRAAEAVIDQAPVSTIHSFCARVLSEFAGLIGLPPDVTIADNEAQRRAASCRDAWRAVVSGESNASLVSTLLDAGDKNDPGGPPLSFETLDKDYQSWIGADRPFLPAVGDTDNARSTWLAATQEQRLPLAQAWWNSARAAVAAVRYRTTARRLLLQSIDDRLESTCKRDGVLTIDGLLRHLRAALRHPSRGTILRAALKSRYQAALIDEFQDTDPVQAEILTSAFSGGFLRCIGDPKQSIYRFRGADLHAYLEFVEASVDSDHREHMVTNFRSAPGCVAAVNHLFREERAPFLQPGLSIVPSKAGRSESHLLDGDARHLVWWWLEEYRKADAETVLTGALAGEVRRLCAQARLRTRQASGEIAIGPFLPRHAAVLTATNRQSAAVAQALRSVGIPAVNRSMEHVCASEAANELGTILASLADPSNGSVARTALCTRLWGGTQDLLTVAGDALGLALANIRALSRSWRHLGVLGVVGRILRQQKSRARILGEAGGERYLTDLFHVAELVHPHGDHPMVALTWLIAQRTADVTADAASLRLEDDGDAVAVMTVHAAKGLEWPVVFAPFLWCTPSPKGMFVSLGKDQTKISAVRPVRFRDEIGWQSDWRGKINWSDACAADADSRAEAVRQTYVALTRAAERTYVAWGPLGGQNSNAARSGLALIAGVSAANCIAPVGLEQTKQTKNWLWPKLPDPATIAAARVLQRRPNGMSKNAFLATGTRETDWKFVSLELREFGWATRDGYTYFPTGKSSDVVPTPPDSERFGAFLGAMSPPAIQVVVPPPTSIERAPRQADQVTLSAALPKAGVLPSWSITSFTGLTKGADEQDLLGALGDEMPGVTDPSPATGIHAFPAGAGPGDCLHRIIERADLVNPRSEPNRMLVLSLLAGERIDTEQTDAVLDLLDELAHSRIPGTRTTLGAVPATSCRHEWPFDCALKSDNGLSGVAAAFRLHADAVLSIAWAERIANLRHHDLTGCLTGRADFIACIDGRWWVVDWKSNRLGKNVDAYSAEAMIENAFEHRYPLQWMLYLIALHRHLGSRIPDYDPARHLGGAAYCYLRGLSRSSPDSGWLVHQPSLGFITAIDSALGGRPHVGSP